MRRSLRFFAALCAALVLSASVGCGPSTGTVSGQVTLDGQPVPKGAISFVASSGTAKPATAEIKDGKYTLTMEPGAKLVQITGPVVVRQMPEYNGPGAPMVDVTGESVPPRYNSASELKIDVSPGTVEKDWPLEGNLLKK